MLMSFDLHSAISALQVATVSHDSVAVHEIVRGVADEDERTGGWPMHLAFVRMTVPPERELLQDEERENSEQQRAEDRPRCERHEGLGQQLEERDAEQRADRVTDERRHEPRPGAGRDEQEGRSDRESAEAAEQAQAEGDGEQAHASRLYAGKCGSQLSAVRVLG